MPRILSVSISFFWLAATLSWTGEDPQKKEAKQKPQTLMESMTVTADRSPTPQKETTAKVTVINDQQIQRQVVNDVADLIRYEPGVYVAGDQTRLGLNGFNIRGIGGNRVLTRIDGVRTAEQFNFGPVAVHQYFFRCGYTQKG